MDKGRIIAIVGIVVLITALHYLTPMSIPALHIVYRELYFVPIILAGLWGGKKGGIFTSVAVSLVYIPHMFMLAAPHPMFDPNTMLNVLISSAESRWGNLFELLFFNLAGFFVGTYADLKQGYVNTKHQPYHATTFKKNFLLYVDDSQVSLYAAKYFADIFGEASDVAVTLLWVSSGTDPDYFETSEEASDYEKTLREKGGTLLGQVKETLSNGGVADDRIRLRMTGADKKEKVSDKILAELKTGEYDTVIVGKHHLTRSQEFLFGSVSVRMVREAGANVLTVKAPADREQHA